MLCASFARCWSRPSLRRWLDAQFYSIQCLDPRRIVHIHKSLVIDFSNLYKYVYVCMYVWMYVCMNVWMNVWMNVCMYVCMYVCMCIDTYIYIHVCKYTDIYTYIIYIHMCIHIYIYVCIHIHIHTSVHINIHTGQIFSTQGLVHEQFLWPQTFIQPMGIPRRPDVFLGLEVLLLKMSCRVLSGVYWSMMKMFGFSLLRSVLVHLVWNQHFVG